MITWQNRFWICPVRVLCGLSLVTAVGCCRVPHPKQPPPPPICNSATQQNGLQVTSCASTTVKKSQFTASLTRSLNGTPAVSETQLVVQRGDRCKPAQPPEISIQVNTQVSATGAVQVMVHYGKGFNGPKNIAFVSNDRATVQGTIDGRALVTFPLKADPKSIKFADGTAIPAMAVDNETKQALPVLLQAMWAQCDKAGLTKHAALVPGGSISPTEDPPGHLFDAESSPPCMLCLLGCESADMVCWAQAFATCSVFGSFYGLCVAGELIVCSIADINCYANKSATVPGINVTVGLCHLLGPSQLTGAPVSSLGPPCCPVVCGPGTGTLGIGSPNWCCGPGETCAGVGPLCCSAGLTACGPNCCTSGETCVGGTTCCPNGSVCGSSCCGAGQTCTGNGTCCPTGNVCGTNCCNTGDTCTNGSCCPAGHAVCNGVCCPNAGSTCDPATNSCSCPAGGSSCGGACCTAGQLCCIGSNGAPQCTTPLPTYMGFQWCADSVNGVYCNNCSSSQVCTSVCTGPPGSRTCSSEYYCH